MVAVVAVGGDDYMVKETEVHELASPFQVAGNVIVLCAGESVAGRVVVAKDYTLCIFKDGMFDG